ncbi:MAG: PrsW family intramembrane metalloprotease [Treponema sp.]|jgi:RsiW-degrading membrane proteinase PrsW (M82 family)|nr:PrsW family intramembrane metalloprotease [Treponema sp.]
MYGTWVILTVIFTSSLPVIAVLIWFRLAKYQFSISRFFLALLAGAAAFFPALLLQDLFTINFLITSQLALFFQYFIRIAFTEEFSRLLMLFIFFLIDRRFNETSNARLNSQAHSGQSISWNAVKKGTATGLIAGLGFALLENSVYGARDASVLLLRVFTATPLHAACGSRVGAAAVMFRTNPLQALFRFFSAVAIHGIYNLMVTRPGFPSIIAILIAISALITAIMAIRGGWTDNAKESSL